MTHDKRHLVVKIFKIEVLEIEILKFKFSKFKFLTSNFSNQRMLNISMNLVIGQKLDFWYSVLAKEPLLYRFDKSCYAILNNKLNQC